MLFLFLPNNFLYAIVPLILLLLDLYYESIDLVVVLGIANVMRQLIYGYHNQHFYQKHAEKYEVDAEAQAEHYCGPHEHWELFQHEEAGCVYENFRTVLKVLSYENYHILIHSWSCIRNAEGLAFAFEATDAE